MAYRDELTALRAELDKARDVIDELEARVTPRLVEELPREVAESLTWIRQQALVAPDTADGLRKHLDMFREYRALLDDVIARAPELEQSLNHLPRAFPERVKPSHRYFFPDIYDPHISHARSHIHRYLQQRDPEVRLRDARARYFDAHADPYLVDAMFHVERAPLRLIVIAVGPPDQMLRQLCYSLFMRTRRSMPTMKLTNQSALDALAVLFRLRRDTKIGDARVDDAIVIDADAEAAERVLTNDVREALIRYHRSCPRATLLIEDGLARAEWIATVVAPEEDVTPAIDLLLAVRRVPPLSLLKKRATRRASG